MNTREDHLRKELRITQAALADIQTQLDGEPASVSKRTQLQARLDVFERRHRVLQHLLHCP